jgi:DNA-binding transcriptional ArsR family regulator
MAIAANIAEVAALVGDPARANMLVALLDGRALTAGELAFAAHISPATASAHLGKLVDGCLLTVLRQGRHHYFRIASPLVARMLESINLVAAIDSPPRYRPTGPRDAALRQARFCYDHLAGRVAVAMADSLVGRAYLVLGDDGGEVTADGTRFLSEFGLDLSAATGKRPFCRPCLDWSERRLHIAGAVGASLARRCFDLGWLERVRDSRAVTITPRGRAGLRATFGLDLPQARVSRAS